MTVKFYKLFNTETNSFSLGGFSSKYCKPGFPGKTWSNIGHLKNHLRQYIIDTPYNSTWTNMIPDYLQVYEFCIDMGIHGPGTTAATPYKIYPAKTLYPTENIYLKNEIKPEVSHSIVLPSDAKFIDNVCFSYRHDFGLLSDSIKKEIRLECAEWIRAIQNNLFRS